MKLYIKEFYKPTSKYVVSTHIKYNKVYYTVKKVGTFGLASFNSCKDAVEYVNRLKNSETLH